ncbi:MAG: hypothetical protein N2749_00805 [Clostridia bacterium]|nr:hypothetical protein [Clostridia bacterium]
MENIKDSFNAKGNVVINVIDKSTGEVVEKIENHNLIVKVGRQELIKLLIGQSNLVPGQTTKITKMGIGKGGVANLSTSPFTPVAPVDGDTGLYTPITNGVNDLTSTVTDLNATNPKVTFTALFDCSVVKSLVNECVLLFNDATTIFARYTFKTVSLEQDSNFSLQISWTIEF